MHVTFALDFNYDYFFILWNYVYTAESVKIATIHSHGVQACCRNVQLK